MSESYYDYDVVIVGGGLVGASLACALAQYQHPSKKQNTRNPFRIAVVEAAAFSVDEQHNQSSFDARTVALAQNSQQIFQTLGLWQAVEELGVMPIHQIHVSDRGHAGVTRLKREDEKVDALGYVVETRVLGQVLTQAIDKLDNITMLCPATLTSLDFSAATATVSIEQNGQSQTLRTQLVVAADGGQSLARQLTGVKTFESDYHQHAVIANVQVDRPHDNIAYERFTDTGPLALLPSRLPSAVPVENEQASVYALVWTVQDRDSEDVASWDEKTFLDKLQQRFGTRAGKFVKSSPRHVYPLKFMHAREHVRPHLAFIGNAAHTLHPVAGQGFNLGLRDVAVLADVLCDAKTENKPLGDVQVLSKYAQWRKRDHLQTSFATDSLVRIFSSKFLPLVVARNLGLVAMDIMPPLKHLMARSAMGYVGKLSRLARGLKL